MAFESAPENDPLDPVPVRLGSIPVPLPVAVPPRPPTVHSLGSSGPSADATAGIT
jgi:hypothetical protein